MEVMRSIIDVIERHPGCEVVACLRTVGEVTRLCAYVWDLPWEARDDDGARALAIYILEDEQ